MLVDITRKELIILINKLTPKTYEDCYKYKKKGMLFFTGHQYDYIHEWNRDYLKTLDDEKLIDFYTQLKTGAM